MKKLVVPGGNAERIAAALERRKSNSAGIHQQGPRKKRARRANKLAAINESALEGKE